MSYVCIQWNLIYQSDNNIDYVNVKIDSCACSMFCMNEDMMESILLDYTLSKDVLDIPGSEDGVSLTAANSAF